MNKQYTLAVQEDESGDLFIQFPEDLMKEAGWAEGDTLNWEDNHNGTFTLTKKVPDTEWVLVECVNSFRTRYMVEVPKGKEKWALDTVSCDDAKEFSQEHLGEHIVSHRVVTKDEALAICDIDNAYVAGWSEHLKETNFFTTWKEQS